MVGPVVKISEDDLPKRPNIHYLGSKTYDQLPSYLAGWDVALMPFAMNESTQFISPTKTPEYLAGGKPVVSTPVKDVVRHYGQLEGVQIARDADSFVAACEKALELAKDRSGGWLGEADLLLSATSWHTTQARMAGLVAEVLGERTDQRAPAQLVAAE
jgi:glycosyltransferase involved in cell wall biosynthesis